MYSPAMGFEFDNDMIGNDSKSSLLLRAKQSIAREPWLPWKWVS